jgi:hypothetical protein
MILQSQQEEDMNRSRINIRGKDHNCYDMNRLVECE